jgi:hypothetical protein
MSSTRKVEFVLARLAEEEAAAITASGGTVVGEPGNWTPAPGGDEWEVHADRAQGDLEILVALRPGLPRPPEVLKGCWGSVISWSRDVADWDAWVPEPQFRHAAIQDPAATLRDIKAKRRIIDWYSGLDADYDYGTFPDDVITALAGKWDNHPDYRTLENNA